MTPELLTSLKLFSPELIIVGAIVILFLTDAFMPESRSNFLPLIATVVACVLGAVATYSISGELAQTFFSGLVANDGFSSFFRYLFFFAAGMSAYLAFGSKELEAKHRMEFTLLLLSVTFGMCLMATSTNLLMLYIGIETVSIISFVMAGFNKENLKSSEASFKYLIFGALSSALMVYGMSLLYGYAGSLHYREIAQFIQGQAQVPFYFWFSAVLIYLGLAYKISSFPMHFWTPDVYEGAPTPIVAFFSVGPKAAGFAALIRILIEAFAIQTPGLSGQGEALWTWKTFETFDWVPFIAMVSVITMTIGNLCALGQKNVKRLLAYSSIAHVGYMLMGLVSHDSFGISSILFYLVVYAIMNLGAFWVVSVVHDLKGHTNLDAFRGLGWTTPVLGVCMAIFLFSLAGIPTFSGFIGKFLLFGAVIKTGGYMWLALIGVLNSVVSLYYYAKIIKAVWLEPAEQGAEFKLPFYHAFAIVGLAIPTIVLGLFFTPLLEFADLSVFFGTL